MKLLYTPNSPYARVARVCALQQEVKLGFEAVAVREQADSILKYNPAAMVPTLVLDNGTFLTETRLICEYFEASGPGGFLSTINDIEGRYWEGIINNHLDGVAVWVRELRRPVNEQSPGSISLEQGRAERCLEYFENQWDTGATSLNYASVMLASSIELIDTRLCLRWKHKNPKLAAWYEAISRNDLLRITAPHPLATEASLDAG